MREAGLKLFKALMLLMTLVSSALAQEGPGIVAGVKDVANQLQLYLDYIADRRPAGFFNTSDIRSVRSYL